MIACSELSAFMTSECTEPGRSMYPSLGLGNSFAFKLEDHKGRVHRFNCGIKEISPFVNHGHEALILTSLVWAK